MDNYEYCAAWAARQLPARVLDYGCGAGQIVELLRARNVIAYGCDMYFGGGDLSARVPEGIRSYVRRMDSGLIPFSDSSFDLVISNQVLEHVPDLATVTAETARVLKPGGRALHLFPDRSVWREGHCEVPFLHRFSKGSHLRLYYAALVRCLGFGARHEGRSIMGWSRYFCQWLDEWTHYRSVEEIHSTFAAHFDLISHAEEHWFSERVRHGRVLPASMQRFIARKWGGMVIELRKA